MDALVSVDYALRAVLTMARVTPGEAVRLGDAVGRTLAEPVASREPHPPFDASAMDGVALRVADLPDSLTLPLAGVVHAGDAPGELASGVAVASAMAFASLGSLACASANHASNSAKGSAPAGIMVSLSWAWLRLSDWLIGFAFRLSKSYRMEHMEQCPGAKNRARSQSPIKEAFPEALRGLTCLFQ